MSEIFNLKEWEETIVKADKALLNKMIEPSVFLEVQRIAGRLFSDKKVKTRYVDALLFFSSEVKHKIQFKDIKIMEKKSTDIEYER